MAAAFGEGTATYEASIGSYGSGNGQFSHPAGIALDAEANLWVVDQGNNRIQKFSDTGEYVSQFGSSGSENGQFSTPKAIAIDAEGNIWVADSGNGRLEQFDDEGEFIRAVGSSGSGNGQFSGPEDIAIDAEGNIWVADTYNYRIQKLDDEGEFIEVVSPEGLGAIEPTGIDVGLGGKVWVTDWAHNRVVGLSEAGAVVSQFGSGGSGNGEFSRPDGIDVDSKGNVWVGDEGNSRVQRFNEKGEYLDQFGSGGSGEGEFSFSYPFGIVADSGASIWVADSSNNRVQKWSTIPKPICHAGSGNTEVDEPLVLEAGALECEGEAPLSYEIVAGSEHGEISEFDPETGALTYTPNSEFTGLDSFTFKAANAVGSSAAKDFNIAVGKLAVCQDGEASTPGGHPLVLKAGALECEGQAPLSYEIVAGSEHGEISEFDPETGALVYTPNPEFSGADSFTFRAVNGLGSSPVQSFAITVQPVPICHAGSGNTEVDEPLVLEAGALECEGEAPLSYEIVSGPEHGEISEFDPETGALTYVPETGFGGIDIFTFRAVNEIGSSAATEFRITVGEVPIAAYSFDEDEGDTVHDLVGENDGTIKGADWTAAGKYGSALVFDGTSSVVIPDTPELDLTGAFTLEAWVRPHFPSRAAAIFTKEDSSSPHYGYQLNANAFGEDLPVAYLAGSGFSEAFVESEVPAIRNEWTHVALTSTGTQAKLYINGELAATHSAVPVRSSNGVLRIGADEWYGEYFDGRIDEIRIYGQALTAEDVVRDRDTPLQASPPPASGPVAAFPFDEGKGAVVHDVAGTNDGEIDGAEWVAGKYGGALHFDAEGEDAVKVPDSGGSISPTLSRSRPGFVPIPRAVNTPSLLRKAKPAMVTCSTQMGNQRVSPKGSLVTQKKPATGFRPKKRSRPNPGRTSR